MNLDVRRDPLTALGVGTGAYLLLAAAATLVGAPWQHGSGTLATALQIVGAVATAGVGAGLAALVTR
jgi:hypothetical protein